MQFLQSYLNREQIDNQKTNNSSSYSDHIVNIDQKYLNNQTQDSENYIESYVGPFRCRSLLEKYVEKLGLGDEGENRINSQKVSQKCHLNDERRDVSRFKVVVNDGRVGNLRFSAQ